MKSKIDNISNLLIGILCIITVIAGYYKDITHMSQWCFISGMVVGCIFIFAFFYGRIKHNKIPAILYLDSMIVLFLILIATVFIRLNLEGAFWFIHIINPMVVLAYFFVFCDCLTIKKPKLVLTSLIFPLAYIIFAFCLWKVSGNCPFPANLILKWDTPLIPLGLIVLLSLIILALGYAMFYLNRFIFQKRVERNEIRYSNKKYRM